MGLHQDRETKKQATRSQDSTCQAERALRRPLLGEGLETLAAKRTALPWEPEYVPPTLGQDPSDFGPGALLGVDSCFLAAWRSHFGLSERRRSKRLALEDEVTEPGYFGVLPAGNVRCEHSALPGCQHKAEHFGKCIRPTSKLEAWTLVARSSTAAPTGYWFSDRAFSRVRIAQLPAEAL